MKEKKRVALIGNEEGLGFFDPSHIKPFPEKGDVPISGEGFSGFISPENVQFIKLDND